ncbi:MAG: hypothetical protein QGF77_02405 [Candidatus Thalassarchaeaceae archaeon]|nr:hypothetical protein [Candidatus Thalassarchaeaceae archaeon]
MPFDPESTASGQPKFELRRIRSGHRRRLLDRLTDGGATVSELARDTVLRIPHASAELRRMRTDGLVASDQIAGSRGARLHLTQSGWEEIRLDELSRAQDAFPLPQPSSHCCLLARDGANLLLGILAPIDSPLVLIPDRPLLSTSTERIYSGSEGVSWTWAILRERSPRWFNLTTLEMLQAPPTTYDPENISSYVGENHIIGIVRARLVDEDQPMALAPGIWFEPPNHRPEPPLPEASHHRGKWILGNCHELSPEIRPKEPIMALMDERLPRSMLLRTARIGALVVADLGGLDAIGDAYPISCLDYWIERAHPRLTASERKRRLSSLRERLTSNRKVRTEESTWRRFRRDWADSEFSTNEESIRLLETRGLGQVARTSLIEWSVSETERPPLVLDLHDSLPEDVLNTVVSHPSLRLALTTSPSELLSIFDELVVDPLRPLPWLRLRTKGGRDLPLRLVTDSIPLLEEEIHEASDIVSPWKILGLENEPSEFIEVDSSMIGSAISQFPEGNEDWANMMEASYPIAAWIASPRRTRWHRWQRLMNRIDSEWLALMDLEFLPLERLAEVANKAPERVLLRFEEQLRIMIRADSEIALRTRPATDSSQASRGDSWVAAQLLANAPWLPQDLQPDLLRWALEAWLKNPPNNSRIALEAVDWMHSGQIGDSSTFDPILQGILRSSRDLPEDHDLKIWSLLVDRIVGGKMLQIEELEKIVKTLPLDWWAPIAPEVLINILGDEESSNWLLQNPLPWSAAILRPEGEVSQSPGLRSITHNGCPPELHVAISRRFRARYERGALPDTAAPIIDLLAALDDLQEGRSPNSGRTHPMVGWLAQPIEKWPVMTNEMVMNGDPHVAERLIKRISGYNNNLFSKQQF